MQISKVLPRIFIVAFVLLPFAQSFPGQQYCIFESESELLRLANENIMIAANSGSLVNVRMESGTNWKNITLEMSTYVYGVTRFRNLNPSGSSNFTKAKVFKDNLSNLKKILGISFENFTDFSGLFSDYERAVSQKQPIPAGVFRKSSKEGKAGTNAPEFTINFTAKVTGSITLHMRNIDGVNSITVSKGKIIRQYCSFRLNDREIMKSLKYYSV